MYDDVLLLKLYMTNLIRRKKQIKRTSNMIAPASGTLVVNDGAGFGHDNTVWWI